MGYPVVLDVSEKLVVLIGGGRVAARRARRLVDAGARLRVVSPEVSDELRESIDAGRVGWQSRGYRKGDVAGALLVIAATDDPETNQQVAEDARAAGILVNVADRHTDGDFSVPALAISGELRIAIDTGGAGPALSAALRRHLEATLSPGWARAAAVMARLRPLVADRHEPQVRRAFWRELAAELPDGAEGEPDEVVAWLEGAAGRSGVDLSAVDLEAVVAGSTAQ